MCLALFDLDGTLVDRRAAFADAIAEPAHDQAWGPEIGGWLRTEPLKDAGWSVGVASNGIAAACAAGRPSVGRPGGEVAGCGGAALF